MTTASNNNDSESNVVTAEENVDGRDCAIDMTKTATDW